MGSCFLSCFSLSQQGNFLTFRAGRFSKLQLQTETSRQAAATLRANPNAVTERKGGHPRLAPVGLRCMRARRTRTHQRLSPVGQRRMYTAPGQQSRTLVSPIKAERAEMADQVGERTTSMQTDLPGERSVPALGWTYDANSGKTTEIEHIEWQQVGRRRKQTSEPTKPSQEKSAQQDKPTPQAPKQRSPKMPPFPTDDFKIVYRPQTGLDLSKWNLTAITHAIGRSSGLTQQDFYDNVRVQMQKIENIIIASTADTERATRLKSITIIQLGSTIFNVNAHVRHPDDLCRGVIYGLLPGTSSAEIVAGLRVDPCYTVLGARMLGRSSTAVITFYGPQVPYYITYQSGDYRCKPYRKSVQYSRKCGAIGHRQDMPQAQRSLLLQVRPRHPATNFPSSTTRLLPRAAHRKAAWLKQLNPAIAVQRIRYADAAQGDSKSHHKHTSVSPVETTAVKALENRVLDQQKMLQSHRDKIQSQGAIVDKLAKLCKQQEKIIKKQNENIEKLTRLFQEQLLSKQPAPNLTKEEIEAVVEARIVSVIETKLAALVGSHLTTLVEPKSTAIVESRLEAIVDTKLEPVTIQSGNTFTTLNRAIDTHTAQINELKSQLTNFIAHVKNNASATRILRTCLEERSHAHEARRLPAPILPKGRTPTIL
ncbi:hypothetical protein HPB50_003156 [Hyalomma asiaticum]|uniref:Uncharacterized protein n=1 Tax=Hyalomma asiaticum TaxID=266040 RepID=A0ACB7TBD6_HYAAI|nr:hypothetical protein HPB50_003156 [Hyalomma asiaticum]